MEQVIKIKGMSCQHCVKMVTKALQSIEGIRRVEVSLEKSEARIETDRPIESRVLDEVLKKAGYEMG